MAGPAPILLRPDNFTALRRTPWAGDRIVRLYKAALLEAGAHPPDDRVGESWEFSAGAELPSRCAGSDRTLAELIADAPEAMLGDEAGRGGASLLVKLLDAMDLLSVQIHPHDDYAALASDESGKPECWYILESEPGAGIYLGLSPDATRESMEEAVAGRGDIRECLRFIEVQAGDFFVVDAGTPHAVGAGVLLLEPQKVQPGRRGVTYRYWDWGRRYDEGGRPAPSGAPRALHVEHALAVTNWAAPMDEARLERTRLRAGQADVGGSARLTPLCGDGGLASAHLRVARLAGSGELSLPGWRAICALTVLEGRVRLAGGASQWWERGQTVALPSAIAGAALELERAHAVLSATRVTPPPG